jgi:hypothetical protein
MLLKLKRFEHDKTLLSLQHDYGMFSAALLRIDKV